MDNETEQIFIVNPSEAVESSVAPQKLDEPPIAPQDGDDFSTVCRTCATVTEFVIPIFDGEGLQNNLAEKIHKHLPIQVSENDVLPRVVCYQCASTLLAWHELVQCCVQADEVLRTRVAVAAAASVDVQPAEIITEPKPSGKEIEQNADQDPNKEIESASTGADRKLVKVEAETKPAGEDVARPSAVSVGEDGRRYATCALCGRNVTASSWRRHARSHRGEKRYSCHTCGLAFGDSGNLARHARALHARRRPHACPACQKTFSRKSHLEDHLKSHSESREFVCDVCGKASKSSAALRMHGKIHGAREFRCMECGAEFKRRGELRAHVTVHTGEKAFACACGKAFRLRSQLTTHARIHAATTSEAGEWRGDTRACSYCADAPPAPHYRRHLVAAHSDRLFHCDECDTYVDRKHFLHHMSLHAVEYAAKQDKENDAPSRASRLRRAKRRSHVRDENANLGRPARGFRRLRGDAPRRADAAPDENAFSDHSDAEYGFAPLPNSVFEAIEDSPDDPPAPGVGAGASRAGDVGSSRDFDREAGLPRVVNPGIGPSQIGVPEVSSSGIVDAEVDSPPTVDIEIDPGQMVDDGVESFQNADIDIGAARIADIDVDPARIADIDIRPAQIADIDVDPAQIADIDVGPARIADNVVDPAQIADIDVGPARIADNDVGPAPIVDAAVGLPQVIGDEGGSLQIVDDKVGPPQGADDAARPGIKTIDTGETERDKNIPGTVEAEAPPGPPEKTPKHKKPRTCPICGKAYTASSSYFYHMKHSHGRKEHECETCGKRFGSRAALAQHRPLHAPERRHECRDCGKRFRSRAGLYIHGQAHAGVKALACAVCQARFRWRTHLARHMLRHRAERAHACAVCGRAFSVRADLLRHARTHAAAAHACAQCPLKFAQLRYLKVHVDRKHGARVSAPAEVQ